jgi:hypothetical protein
MADFVAVIRRAVDGLTENTPDMRNRVYEKARGAVMRQLENMNPRPPEAMFQRQMEKLDAAIRLVEQEHAEALPADAVPELAPAVETAPVAAPPFVEAANQPAETPAVEIPAAAARPAVEAARPAVEPGRPAVEPLETRSLDSRPAHQQTSGFRPAEAATPEVDANMAAQPVERPPAAQPAAPVFETAPTQAAIALDSAPVAAVPADLDAGSWRPAPVAAESAPAGLYPAAPVVEPHPAASIAPLASKEDDDPLLAHFEPAREPATRHANNRVMEQPLVEAESEFPGAEPATPPVVMPFESAPIDQRPADIRQTPAAAIAPQTARTAPVSDWDVDIDREPEQAAADTDHQPHMPRAALTEADVATDFNAFLRNEFSTPAVKPPPSRKEAEADFSWDAPFEDLPDLPKPVAFQEALQARQEEMTRTADAKVERSRPARSELEDLIGYKPADGEVDATGDKLPPEVSPRAMSKLQSKGFRVHKKEKRRFNALPIAFGVAGALVVAGGAYGLYLYRDNVSALVASYMPASKPKPVSETRAVESKPADQAKATDTKPAQTASEPAVTEEKPTEVASLDSNIVPSKFTQRLLEDGTETETDAAKIPVDQSLTEGKTVAGQTEVASSDPNPTTTQQTAETPAGIVATQKMFLYEERLGGSPVAVPGTVSWSLKPDTTASGGKEQPLVEATVEVPERKLKAVISFKRNSDPSLPASHIIEVVFDLPDDFPEGNVESVQRVAFKQTEQDRGNGLIAVPAKITDDFHMIALNDDADARKVNLELMKSRSWIDIPIVYRNNRRALLTFEKGSTGTEAFDKALAEWAALGPTATNN